MSSDGAASPNTQNQQRGQGRGAGGGRGRGGRRGGQAGGAGERAGSAARDSDAGSVETVSPPLSKPGTPEITSVTPAGGADSRRGGGARPKKGGAEEAGAAAQEGGAPAAAAAEVKGKGKPSAKRAAGGEVEGPQSVGAVAQMIPPVQTVPEPTQETDALRQKLVDVLTVQRQIPVASLRDHLGKGMTVLSTLQGGVMAFVRMYEKDFILVENNMLTLRNPPTVHHRDVGLSDKDFVDAIRNCLMHAGAPMTLTALENALGSTAHNTIKSKHGTTKKFLNQHGDLFEFVDGSRVQLRSAKAPEAHAAAAHTAAAHPAAHAGAHPAGHEVHSVPDQFTSFAGTSGNWQQQQWSGSTGNGHAPPRGQSNQSYGGAAAVGAAARQSAPPASRQPPTTAAAVQPQQAPPSAHGMAHGMQPMHNMHGMPPGVPQAGPQGMMPPQGMAPVQPQMWDAQQMYHDALAHWRMSIFGMMANNSALPALDLYRYMQHQDPTFLQTITEQFGNLENWIATMNDLFILNGPHPPRVIYLANLPEVLGNMQRDLAQSYQGKLAAEAEAEALKKEVQQLREQLAFQHANSAKALQAVGMHVAQLGQVVPSVFQSLQESVTVVLRSVEEAKLAVGQAPKDNQ